LRFGSSDEQLDRLLTRAKLAIKSNKLSFMTGAALRW
jgi:hypothetical protein